MKIHRQRYKTGSVRKVPRAHGFAWEFRSYYTNTNGKRKLKVQAFNAAIYKTERDVRASVDAQLASLDANSLTGRACATFGQVINRYLRKELARLRHSTRITDTSLLELHVRPKWSNHWPSDIEAL